MQGFPGVPLSALSKPPEINWRHIDGPLLTWAGRMHWLTLRERVRIAVGLETAQSLARKHFSGPQTGLF